MAAEPVTNSFIVGGLAAVLSHYFPGITASVVIGSLAGATVFFMTTEGYTNKQKYVLAIVSFFIGLIAAKETAAYIDSATPEAVRPGSAFGALVASAFAVHIILFVKNKLTTAKDDKKKEDQQDE